MTRFYLEREVLGYDDELMPAHEQYESYDEDALTEAMFAGAEPDVLVEIMSSLPTFEEAVDWASDNLVRKAWADAYNILIGDGDGPDERVARIERADVAENARAFARNAELVLTIEVPARVPREFVELATAEDTFTAIGGPGGDTEYTVLVQLAPRATPRDESSKRYMLMEMASPRPAQREDDRDDDREPPPGRFQLLELNPRKGRRGVFTVKGERMYRAVLASSRMAAEARRRGAPAEAKRAVVRAAQRGVPGLVRKNPSSLERYKKLVSSAGYWADPHYPFQLPVSRELGEYIGRVPEDADRGFWLGEVWDDIRIDARRELSPAELRELDAHIDEVRARVDQKALTPNPVRYTGHEPPEIFAEDAEAAIDKYKEFHRYDPKKVEEIRGLAIPRRVKKLGPAAYVLYRSGKVDPATLKKPKRPVDYIHEHDAGVTVYSTEGAADTEVPRSIYEATALVRLGYCLGFKLKDGTEAQGTPPLPDLCCTPDGKCLLIVQSKKKVLAMFWGGALGVFARGIDG